MRRKKALAQTMTGKTEPRAPAMSQPLARKMRMEMAVLAQE